MVLDVDALTDDARSLRLFISPVVGRQYEGQDVGTSILISDVTELKKAEGIRIILDGVFSHTGSDSRYFNREGRYGPGGAYRDRHSPYRSWYDFDSGYACGYRSWWGFETLPEVEEESPSYIDFVCGPGGVIDTWLGLGASGFRLDVADELPDDFIEKIRAAVKAHGADKLLIGEVWEDATTKEGWGRRRTYLRGHGLDTTMNYPFRNAAIDFVRGADAAAVADAILSICENYPKPALDCAMNFLSTHDTERAITAIADEPTNGRDRFWQSGRRIPLSRMDDAVSRELLAYALLFTLPGVPCIYYGDEIAMQGYRDPFNRAYYDWNSTERRLRGPLANLAELRRSCDAFKGGAIEWVEAAGDVLHFRRVGRTQTAEIILNRSASRSLWRTTPPKTSATSRFIKEDSKTQAKHVPSARLWPRRRGGFFTVSLSRLRSGKES